MMRKQIDHEAIKGLKKMAEDNNVQTTIVAANILDPLAADLACEAMEVLDNHLKNNGSPVATLVLGTAAMGFLHGSLLDPRAEGVSEAVDLVTEMLVKVFRASVETGYAAAVKGIV